jgi:hypothetical protein
MKSLFATVLSYVTTFFSQQFSRSALARVLQRNRANGMSIRNQLTWLWRLRSLKICTWQAGDPGKLMVSFQSMSKAWVPGEPLVPVWKPEVLTSRTSCCANVRQEKIYRPIQAVRQKKSVLLRRTSCCVLFWPSPDWMKPIYSGYSVLQFKCESQITLKDAPRIIPDQQYGHPVTQSSCCIKLTAVITSDTW